MPLLLISIAAKAQQSYYFIVFKDKPHAIEKRKETKQLFSQKSINRRVKYGLPLTEQDIPPYQPYIDSVLQEPCRLIGKSRWFNGVLILAEPKTAETLKNNYSFILETIYAGKYKKNEGIENKAETDILNDFNMLEESFNSQNLKDSVYYGLSKNQLEQINVNPLHKQNLWGKDILIAVFDAGFKNAPSLKATQHLIKKNKVKYIYDYVENIDNVFDDDDHGLAVLSVLAANQPHVLMGAAPDADYILIRTENAASENLVEEYFWLLAAEFADSAGADIINSSLGYTQHDEKIMGHTYKELNGKTTIISRAAETAAQKGILVFVSAGNEGNDPWRYIAAPADAESVISVGAVDKHTHYAGFSSVGPTADKRIKPDLAALGRGTAILNDEGKAILSNGTSYACPVIAGATALLIQKYPDVSPLTIKNALLYSGNNIDQPDMFTGYGIPNFSVADFILNDQQIYGIAYARTLNNSVQVILNAYTTQKVKLTIYNTLNENYTVTVSCTAKGYNNFMLQPQKKFINEKIKAIEAEFLTTGHTTVFVFN